MPLGKWTRQVTIGLLNYYLILNLSNEDSYFLPKKNYIHQKDRSLNVT